MDLFSVDGQPGDTAETKDGAAAVSAIANIRLPNFRRHSPLLWFVQAYAIFSNQRIKSDVTRVNHVLTALDEDGIRSISSVLIRSMQQLKVDWFLHTLFHRRSDFATSYNRKTLVTAAPANYFEICVTLFLRVSEILALENFGYRNYRPPYYRLFPVSTGRSKTLPNVQIEL